MDFRKCNREKVFRYSIRKYHFGAASVAVAALMFLGARASVVQADTTVNATEVSLENSVPKSDSAAGGTSEASNGSERSADETSNSVQRTPVGSDRDASPSSNNGESSEGSDRSSRSAVSGSDRGAEDTSNSGQHTPVGSERSAGEGPNTVSRASQHAPVRRARSVGEDRASSLNGGYVYGVNQYPVPDDKYNDKNYLYEHWPYAKNNWLNANTKTKNVFEVFTDPITDVTTVRRRVKDPNKNGPGRDNVYRDESETDPGILDIFQKHPDAKRILINMGSIGENIKVRVIGDSNQELAVLEVPKEDVFMKQSEWEVKKKERERQEAETGTAKNAAKADLDKAAETEKAEINADPSLTAKEKEQKVKDLEAKLTEEKGKIDTAADADAVAKAKESGEAAIGEVHTNGDLTTVKNAAKADLDKAAE
ncbi:YSIRK-type signal peptide-containing protein, partial [Streptococcus pseudopneumoniae]|uniref:YSIRK-type signal peptide-containing protein n=1 Tax=Streptococcus pseudopneumoniae TaxID=257758 RepID=UPI0015C39FCE